MANLNYVIYFQLYILIIPNLAVKKLCGLISVHIKGSYKKTADSVK
jgi:hypothetical protein